MFRRIGTSTMLVTVLCALAMAEANAELPKSCLQDLRSFEDQSTTITVSWQCTRSGARLAEALAKVGLADADIAAITRPVQVEFSWQEGSSFTHQLFWTPTSSAEPNRGEAGALVQAESEMSFDRETFYLGSGQEVFAQRGLSPALQIHTKEHVRQNKVLRDHAIANPEFLDHAGFYFPKSMVEHDQKPQSSITRYLSLGARVRRVEDGNLAGTKTLRVDLETSDRRIRFDLDPQRGHVLLRRIDSSVDGKPLARVECSGFQQLSASGVWLPGRITVDRHTWKPLLKEHYDRPVLRETYDLIQVDESRQPNGRFSLRYDTPGTFVADSRFSPHDDPTSSGIAYRVPADPDDLDQVIASVRSGRPFVPRANTRSRGLLFFNGVSMALAVAAVGFLRVNRTLYQKRSG